MPDYNVRFWKISSKLPRKIDAWKRNKYPLMRYCVPGKPGAQYAVHWATKHTKIVQRVPYPAGSRKLYRYEIAKRVPEKIRKVRYNISKFVIPKVNYEYGLDYKIIDTSMVYFNKAAEEHFKTYNYYYRTMYS